MNSIEELKKAIVSKKVPKLNLVLGKSTVLIQLVISWILCNFRLISCCIDLDLTLIHAIDDELLTKEMVKQIKNNVGEGKKFKKVKFRVKIGEVLVKI